MLPTERTIVPHCIHGQEPITLPRATLVREAVQLMARRRIGAVMIVEDDKLLGIFTERDAMVRIVAETRDPDATTLGEVMTADPQTIKASDSVVLALEVMSKRGFRHLPVMEGGKLYGIVSIRDLYRNVKEQMDDDILMLAETLIQG
jgi:CBS domain-containing protein